MEKEITKIAVLGASPKREKYGNVILRDLLAKGYTVVPVNPVHDEIEGIKTVRRPAELPDDIDLLVFVVPPAVGLELAEETLEAGFKKLWFQPGAESDKIVSFLRGRESVKFSIRNCIMKNTMKQGDLHW